MVVVARERDEISWRKNSTAGKPAAAVAITLTIFLRPPSVWVLRHIYLGVTKKKKDSEREK